MYNDEQSVIKNTLNMFERRKTKYSNVVQK